MACASKHFLNVRDVTYMDYQALGQRARMQRERLKRSQACVAFMADISTSFYGHIERGTRKASIETLLALAQALETTPDALLGIDAERGNHMPTEVVQCIRSMHALLDQVETYCV